MLTYQVRKRVFVRLNGKTFDFPNSVEILFVFQPLQPFGSGSDDGRTAVKGVEVDLIFNANTGRHAVKSKVPLQPLDVTIEDPVWRLEFRGNEVRVFTHCKNMKELKELVEAIYYGLPMLLNVEFADPPIVERVSGKIGDTSFQWLIDDWRMPFITTTQQRQEEKVNSSWLRFDLISQPANRRLLAALNYFHVACRLSRAGNSPWEFMGEIILNLSKVLEVLFPPLHNEKPRDAVRAGLKTLDYSEDEIERNFIPIMELRNYIDVAHVHLSVFNINQLQVLHRYTELIEDPFRQIFHRLFHRIETGQYQLPPFDYHAPKLEAVRIIEKLAPRK